MIPSAKRLIRGPLIRSANYTVESSITLFLYVFNQLHIVFMRIVPQSVRVWWQKFLQDIFIAILKVGPIPEHVSFIMDGNRRYAKSNNLPLKKGHEAGGFTLLTLVYICKKMGVKCVSAYAFSIENFNRSEEEVQTLMALFNAKLEEFANRAQDYKDPLYGSKLRIVGDKRLLTPETRAKLKEVERLTKDGKDFTFYVCFPYTSRNDIQHAIYRNSKDYIENRIKLDDINLEKFSEKMYLDEFSQKCDILIRTSGHRRLSDYMLWQSHQSSTIEFVPTLWPDFTFTQMCLIFFRWSFFTTIQMYNEHEGSQQYIWKNFLPSIPFMNKTHYEPLESLADPPVAVSVLG
ncbi:similar to Saccharomyces cerevisiae YMR101C SRT1 Cis-prenyltransferase involved in synthesis of long-chain dolichols [Maudiozyma saulgeensis]|uniref:Alkyl transferase n=1 Tax=Maudiozyma saulgeensis TaxID=1789683 RepID=A0A1X7R104_9SACH|nr:similar to Saccharomyces cerevisiae YMR101C SRT1 Cis-prenyltransferase involved in synthesis of long-chain dolichols [Kazachstania saulgeensis]